MGMVLQVRREQKVRQLNHRVQDNHWKQKKLEKKEKANAGSAKKSTPPPEVSSNDADTLNEQLEKQGNKVRELKSAKAGKPEIDAAVKELLDLKAKYKACTGKDWKLGGHVSSAKAIKDEVPTTDSNNADQLNEQLEKQGNEVRQLKSAKAGKSDVDAAVKLLLELKAKYKECTGKDWKLGEHVSKTSEASKPQVADKKKEDKKKSPSPQKEASPVAGGEPLSELGAQLNDDIIAQGNKVRQLKTEKADEVAIKTAVNTLLGLKAKFKKVVGSDWKPAGSAGNKGKEKPAQ